MPLQSKAEYLDSELYNISWEDQHFFSSILDEVLAVNNKEIN